MRTSSKRTPVAILRNIIGQKTPEFAEMVGLSLSAVEKLESGRLKISDAVAQRISFETGVDARWLLAGDPQRRPFPDILSPRPGKDSQQALYSKDQQALYSKDLYSKEVFDRVRAARQAKESPFPEGEHTREEQIICLLFRLLCIYSSARTNGEEVMALYRLHNIEGDLAEELGFSADESAFELALEAGRCLPELANYLKRNPENLSDLACAPGEAEPLKFLLFRRAIAKAMRAINEARKGDSKARCKTQPAVSLDEEGIPGPTG
jgi:transcriptional regulator with XRE-family HTH domain